jgi:hypothetical protein
MTKMVPEMLEINSQTSMCKNLNNSEIQISKLETYSKGLALFFIDGFICFGHSYLDVGVCLEFRS